MTINSNVELFIFRFAREVQQGIQNCHPTFPRGSLHRRKTFCTGDSSFARRSMFLSVATQPSLFGVRFASPLLLASVKVGYNIVKSERVCQLNPVTYLPSHTTTKSTLHSSESRAFQGIPGTEYVTISVG